MNTSTSLLPQSCAPASRCLQIWHVGGGTGEGSGALSPTRLSLNWVDLSVSFSRGGKGVQRKNQNNPSIQALEYLNWAQISPSTSQSLLWNKRTHDDLQQFGMIYTHAACVTLQCYFKTYQASEDRMGVRFRFATLVCVAAQHSCRTSFSCVSPVQIRGTVDLIHIAFAIVYFRSNSI